MNKKVKKNAIKKDKPLYIPLSPDEALKLALNTPIKKSKVKRKS